MAVSLLLGGVHTAGRVEMSCPPTQGEMWKKDERQSNHPAFGSVAIP